MSIQSDIEMLSIQALEYYSKEHGLPETDTLELFHLHQVFEKIILQHEYLHQLDFSETIRYVEEIVNQKDSTLILYHGSNILFHKIDLLKSHNRRDFGRGFYCTVLEKQAEDWAHRLYLRNFTGKEYVYKYIFRQTDSLRIKRFSSLNIEWLEFVKKNRIKGGTQHHYDVVVGPVADDNINRHWSICTLNPERSLTVFNGKYYFNGKDITMNLCIQIRDVVDIIKAHTGMSFPDAVYAFYHSKTYKVLQNTENTLWAESAGYIADRYFEEQEMNHIV